MASTLCIRDESVGGQALREWGLEVLTDRLSVRELIRSRVYQEVGDYNLNRSEVFQGLVQPEDAEKMLNGWKVKNSRLLDWKKQYDLAVDAFQRNQILILINDQQVESLDEEILVGPETFVTFLRLTLLVGG